MPYFLMNLARESIFEFINLNQSNLFAISQQLNNWVIKMESAEQVAHEFAELIKTEVLDYYT